jgi:allantoate deiminase
MRKPAPPPRARRSAVVDPTPLARANGAEPADPSTSPARADPSRISAMLSDVAEIGADPTGGISRLAFTLAEREAHALVGGWLRELGLAVRQDAVGNTLAERAGSLASAPAIGLGSHLDSVPHGGRFDGIVGVVGAVEAVRLLEENRVRTAHPLRVVVFAGEEGARFGEPCIGSKFVAGVLDGRDVQRVRDAEGTTLAEAMASVGLEPGRTATSRWDAAEWAAFLELHIEQARVLEEQGYQIGIVDVVSGSTRLRAVLHGRADHSGGTPMGSRSDALTAAAEVVLAAEGLANDPRHRGTRTTVGRMDIHPNSITTIPGRVALTVDVRDIDSERQRRTAAEVVVRARQICERRGLGLEVELIADTSPSVLPMWLREITSAACRDLGLKLRVITSGASHDSQIVNRVVPAGMVFVPSKEGLSHVPEEWTSASDIARGVDVLYHSLLRLDAQLAEWRAEPSDVGADG